jgi:hypothetical protein
MRATIRDGELTLVPRQLATVTGGPIGCLARAALPQDASVADLRFGVEQADAEDPDEDEPQDADECDDEDADLPEVEDRTVAVRFLANDRPAARRALKRWAARTGYERIWFRDEVCDLEPPRGLDRELGTTCPCCGLEITDSGQDLVSYVHEAGHFPLNCFICGAFVPQWTPVRDTYAADDAGRYDEPAEPQALRVVGDRNGGEG